MSAVSELQQRIIDTGSLPVHDLSAYLEDSESELAKSVCSELAETLHECGCVVIRDPRVPMKDNDTFIDMIERYFEQPYEVKAKDFRPELHYQVGTTPNGVETPRCTKDPKCKEIIETQAEGNKAHLPTGSDPKWRIFWTPGSVEPPTHTRFPLLNPDPVIPEGFPEWESVMNGWGGKLLESVTTVAEMAAVGLGLERTAFSSMMQHAPHKLAPTGTPLAALKEEGEIFAGFHYDLSFLTIHGKSRYPGLYIWLKSGRKLLVRVPDGCLIVQAGMQMQILTAGHVMAGYHEVVMAPETLVAIDKAKAAGHSLWRVSSTLFGHIASDQILRPLGHFSSSEEASAYPPIAAGDQVQAELDLIKLATAPSS